MRRPRDQAVAIKMVSTVRRVVAGASPGVEMTLEVEEGSSAF